MKTAPAPELRPGGLPVPPAEYMQLVCGFRPDYEENFFSAAEEVVTRMRWLYLLEPGTRLLDIGCGCGRIARQLLSFPLASYTGFDRHPGMIAWSQDAFAGVAPHYRFLH